MSDRREHMSRGLLRGPELMALVRYYDPAGDNDLRPYFFTRQIYTVVDAGAQFEIALNDEVLKVGSSYGDHTYGFFSSVREPIKDAKSFCEKHAIDVYHKLHVRVMLTLTETPVLMPDTSRPDPVGSYKNPFALPPKDWFIANEKASAWEAELAKPWGERDYISRDSLEPRDLPPVMIWSSRFAEEQNASALAEARSATAGSSEEDARK